MSEAASPVETGPVVVYDGDCPFCTAYVRLARLRHAAGPVTLVNARESAHPALARVRAAGLDLDRGMVVDIGGQLFHADRAMTVLAMLTSPQGLFNRTVAWTFRSPARARLLYPPLVAGRNLTLRLLRQRRISNPRGRTGGL